MIVGAFLAEAASVVDNKLNVSGGVLYRFAVDPDRSAQFLLVVLTQAETDDPDRRVDVEVWPPTGDDAHHIEFELPEAAGYHQHPTAVDGQVYLDPEDGESDLGGAGTISLPLIVTG